jgi:L-threonine aldolase (EC 4.1.2.5)
MDHIDLRSDTVTWPTDAMRRAMAEAPVGDDVYGDDPTINELERLAADMTGKEAALFVPSGTFGNQLSLFTWCPRGSEVILGEQCHIIQHEAGAASVIAGVQTRPIFAPAGILPPEAIEERIRGNDIHFPPTSLVCLENAHSSGRVVPLSYMREVADLAHRHGLPVHLDGARLFNAATALGVDATEIAGTVDSVMFCLSKGLCAPVGSMLAGPRDFVEKARRKRKIMGGGMRQAGVLAAAGSSR